ncbi:hypothetical protein JCM11251_001849 [Rhodosporidiobolus azoricus]
MSRYEPLDTSGNALELGVAGRGQRDRGGGGETAAVRWAKQYGGWVVATLVLIHSLGFSSSSSRSDSCWDPYNAIGYIHRPSNGSMRWIPYPPSSSSSRRLLSHPSEIDDALDPPPEALALAPPPYGDMLNEIRTGQGLRDMEWARGKKVAFIGDSHDRYNVETFCHQARAVTGAELSVPHYHIKAHCRIPDLDLTFAAWFHYGLAPESDSLPQPPSGTDEGTTPSPTVGWNIPSLPTSHVNENPPPYAIEGRMREYWLPDTETGVADGGLGGKPDLVVINSFFWDLRYFALHARHYPSRASSLRAEERPLTYSELAWHRGRVRDYVELIRKAFPGVPVMFRLGQEHATNRNEGNVAVFQLNESIRAALRELNVPVFEWARLISGESKYNDDQHLTPGTPHRLFTDMALFYLHKAVTGWNRCEKPPETR